MLAVEEHVFFMFFVIISLAGDGPQSARRRASTCQVANPTCCNVAVLPVVTKDLPISPRFSPLRIFITMQVQHSYNSSTKD